MSVYGFPTNPESFMASELVRAKMRVGNIISKCIYNGIWPMFAQKGMYLMHKSSN